MPYADRPPGGHPGTPLLADLPADLPPVRPIVALRVIADALELPLPWSAKKRTLVLGSALPPADVALPFPQISRRHAALHQRGSKVAIIDTDSRNGIYHRSKDEREREILVSAGELFWIADKHTLALDADLLSLRAHVGRVLGYEAHKDVDLALSGIAPGGALLLLGKPGCDQAALAATIHKLSARRQGPFIEASALSGRASEDALLAKAWGGTLFIDLRVAGRLTASFVTSVFAPSMNIRPIIASPTCSAAESAFGKDRARGLTRLIAAPLADRARDVPRIFDELFRSELDSEHNVAELGAHNVKALMAYPWPDNIAGIRRVLEKVHTQIETGSIMETAERLGIKHQALRETFESLGLSFERASRR